MFKSILVLNGWSFYLQVRLLEMPTEIMGSPKMQSLLQEVKNRYKDRYILIDSPPLLTFADALTLSPYVDAVLLVVEGLQDYH
ncbi:hypothetical protein BLFGPEAP_02195 [Candidatus Methanoperedenaceae archaeon GB50]|nr:hypothetical protein BLFGPEAP_02195 [Candidatus Methanoperedenaceae archaeon GB50]